mgnify:CR=1 FL=1
MGRRARTRVPRTVPPGQLRRTLEAIRRFRTNFVFGTLIVLFAVMLGRLGKLQLVEGERYRAEADKRHQKFVDFKRMRGRIVDRFGWPVATSRPIRTVAFDANPEVIEDSWTFAMQTAALLSGEPGADEIQRKIERARAQAEAKQRKAPGYVVLRRRIEDPLLIERLDIVASMSAREKQRVGLYGLLVTREERRRYPNGAAAAHLTGRVPPDDDAFRVGVEGHYNERLAGRDVYVREGCYNCHSQMIRPFRSETERYGPYTTAGETVYDRPFQFGSKRTGPDLARVGGRYSDEWQRLHLVDPRALVPESNMPGYPWLEDRTVDPELITVKMRRLQMLGDPYTDEQIAGAAAEVEGKTEMDAVIAYLQDLGTNRRARR